MRANRFFVSVLAVVAMVAGCEDSRSVTQPEGSAAGSARFGVGTVGSGHAARTDTVSIAGTADTPTASEGGVGTVGSGH